MQFLYFYELILDLIQGIKKKVLTSALMYVYDISTVMSPGAASFNTVTMLRIAITKHFTIWWFFMDRTCGMIQKYFCEWKGHIYYWVGSYDSLDSTWAPANFLVKIFWFETLSFSNCHAEAVISVNDF